MHYICCSKVGIFRTGVDIGDDFEGEKAGDGEDIDLESEEAGKVVGMLIFTVDTSVVVGLQGEEKTALIGRGFS